jgi:hypothetical protein
MEHETAGDPVSGCKWTRKTTAKVAKQLKRAGIRVSPKTVGRLLKQMKRNPPDPRERDQQFRYIRGQIQDYVAQGMPVVSVDAKSRELIGAFHQPGRKWSQQPIRVFDHDFPSDAKGVALPYGIYDLARNEGFVCIGTSRDTSQFAVNALRTWWFKAGTAHYPHAERLLILADCGGSNGYRTRLWKHQLQVAFCNRFNLQVKVCHYPPGSSKWNPIEHRMFSFISNNWAGQPLLDYETVLKFIRTTKTTTGLKIRALLNKKQYRKGIKISDRQMKDITLNHHTTRPKWNYSICPSEM